MCRTGRFFNPGQRNRAPNGIIIVLLVKFQRTAAVLPFTQEPNANVPFFFDDVLHNRNIPEFCKQSVMISDVICIIGFGEFINLFNLFFNILT